MKELSESAVTYLRQAEGGERVESELVERAEVEDTWAWIDDLMRWFVPRAAAAVVAIVVLAIAVAQVWSR